MEQRVGVFGGTFDPIHTGHVHLALRACAELALTHMRMMPAHLPPHRATPSVGAEQRAEMVRLAISSYPQLSLDDRELKRSTTSYTIDSLRELRGELGAKAGLYFVMGMDSLNALTTWRDWARLTEFAHLLVFARPGQGLRDTDSALSSWLSSRLSTPEQAKGKPFGCVVILAADSPESATQVRADLMAGATKAGQVKHEWLTPSVSAYIEKHHLYSSQA